MKRVSVLVCSLVVALGLCFALTGCASKEYKPEKKTSSISNSTLVKEGTLTVGVDSSNAPYAVESSGQIIGIDVDIAAAIADDMGLQLELVDVGSGAAKAISEGKVDMVMGIDIDNSAYWRSDAYLTSSVVLFSLDQTAKAPGSGSSEKIAAQSSSNSALYATEAYGEKNISLQSDLQSVFDALQSGQVPLAASDSIIGAYVAHSSNIEAYPIARLGDATKYTIAVSTKKTELKSAVENSLKTVSAGGVIDVITEKWLGNTTDISSLSKVTAKAPTSDDSSSSDSSSSNN